MLRFWSAHGAEGHHDRAPSARESFDRLLPEYRQLLWCRFVDGCSLAEVARSMHVTVDYALMLQLRALRALQREQAHAEARLAATVAVPTLTQSPRGETGVV